MATYQDTLQQGREVEGHFVRQIPIQEMAAYRQAESDPVALVTFCVPDLDVIELDHARFLALLDAAQEVNGPLARRLETEEAKASARQMTLLREHQPALYEKAEAQMVAQLEALMTAGVTSPTSSPASAAPTDTDAKTS